MKLVNWMKYIYEMKCKEYTSQSSSFICKNKNTTHRFKYNIISEALSVSDETNTMQKYWITTQFWISQVSINKLRVLCKSLICRLWADSILSSQRIFYFIANFYSRLSKRCQEWESTAITVQCPPIWSISVTNKVSLITVYGLYVDIRVDKFWINFSKWIL